MKLTSKIQNFIGDHFLVEEKSHPSTNNVASNILFIEISDSKVPFTYD